MFLHFRFREGVSFAFPCIRYTFDRGGGTVAVTMYEKVEKALTPTQLASHAIQTMLNPEVRQHFKEFHTRAQRKMFQSCVNNVAKGMFFSEYLPYVLFNMFLHC